MMTLELIGEWKGRQRHHVILVFKSESGRRGPLGGEYVFAFGVVHTQKFQNVYNESSFPLWKVEPEIKCQWVESGR